MTLRTIAVSALLLLLAVAPASAEPRAVRVAANATLMFYNSPLAVWSAHAKSVFVSYASADGVVYVARIDPGSGAVAETGAVHDFGEPDDHAPPALHEIADGPHAGKLLAATAHHSSPLFVYRARHAGRVDGFEEVCRLDGLYTYPRIVEEHDGSLGVILRHETPTAASTAGSKGYHIGKLVKLALDPATGRCGEETDIATPPVDEGVVYAATPMAGWRDDPVVLWSNLAYADFGSRDLMAKDLRTGEARNWLAQLSDADRSRQVLAWSSATIGGERFVSYTAFGERTRCCLLGSSSLVLFRESDGPAAPVLRLDDRPMPYYPAGITLNADGLAEALAPDMAAAPPTLARRSIGRGEEGRTLPSCPVGGVPAMAQYVRHGGGAYVWAEFADRYDQNDFNSTVKLCLVD